MDIKITKKRFSNLISYDWYKIALVMVACIVAWILLFTVFATRVTVGEQFYLVVYEGVYTKKQNGNVEFLESLKNDVFSYDILSTQVNEITTAGTYSAEYMLSIRLSTQEGDVLIIDDGEIGKPVVEEGKQDTAEEYVSPVQGLVNGSTLYSIEDFLQDARDYCVDSGFIVLNGDGSTPTDYTVNEQKIEKYFREVRIPSAKNYRRTFNNEQKIAEGVKLEVKRIENIYLNYLSVSSAIQKAKDVGEDFLWYTARSFADLEGNVITEEIKPYAINLGKLSNGASGKPTVDEMWYTIDKSDKTRTDNLLLCVFDFSKQQPDLQYESLAFLNNIIRTYSNYAD